MDKSMSPGAKSELEAFDSLSAEEREEVLGELLRRAVHSDHELVTKNCLLQQTRSSCNWIVARFRIEVRKEVNSLFERNRRGSREDCQA